MTSCFIYIVVLAVSLSAAGSTSRQSADLGSAIRIGRLFFFNQQQGLGVTCATSLEGCFLATCATALDANECSPATTGTYCAQISVRGEIVLRCVARKGIGAACTQNVECFSNNCDNAMGGTNLCVA